jgi:hypothetical protein
MMQTRINEIIYMRLADGKATSPVWPSVLLFQEFLGAGKEFLSGIGNKGFGIRVSRSEHRRNQGARLGTHLVTV